jgi:hypothetical protein
MPSHGIPEAFGFGSKGVGQEKLAHVVGTVVGTGVVVTVVGGGGGTVVVGQGVEVTSGVVVGMRQQYDVEHFPLKAVHTSFSGLGFICIGGGQVNCAHVIGLVVGIVVVVGTGVVVGQGVVVVAVVVVVGTGVVVVQGVVVGAGVVVMVVTTVVGGRQHQDGVQPHCQQGCALVFFLPSHQGM